MLDQVLDFFDIKPDYDLDLIKPGQNLYGLTADIITNLKPVLESFEPDYVFDGTNHKPYAETDTPNPQSVYGQTKLDGKLAMQNINPENSIIIRTSWVYSSYGNNFVKTMLLLGKERDELNVVADQIGTPTYAGDLAQAILTLLPQINNETVELFHYSNEGVCSWYDFAKAIFEIANIKVKVNTIESAQYQHLLKGLFIR